MKSLTELATTSMMIYKNSNPLSRRVTLNTLNVLNILIALKALTALFPERNISSDTESIITIASKRFILSFKYSKGPNAISFPINSPKKM